MSLIEPRPYFTLSHFWGDPQFSRRILLENGTVIVTGSLSLALKAVRKSFASKHTCINQNDGQERSQQVRNMRQIYSRVREVFP